MISSELIIAIGKIEESRCQGEAKCNLSYTHWLIIPTINISSYTIQKQNWRVNWFISQGSLKFLRSENDSPSFLFSERKIVHLA